ncbi:MAG: hypothetical protein CM1200mP30_24430 [Pseudomonadota bacterium]|nr:MAG: hypothetical protein CM1200mP30_24430 [Pseudomonadota bacterium]
MGCPISEVSDQDRAMNFSRMVLLLINKPIPVAVAITVPTHQTWRDSSSAAVIPGGVWWQT